MTYRVIFWTSVLVFYSVIPSTHPFIWNSPTTPAQMARSPSNITISIGNRYNTQAAVDDAGTNITGLTITLNRWSGKVSLAGNGNQIEVSSTGNESTVIRVGFEPGSTGKSDEDPIPSINNTIPSRRKRDTGGFIPTIPIPPTPFIPSVPPAPAVPIPTMDSNFIKIDGKLIRLPDSVANLTGNATTPATEPMKYPWQVLPTLIERRPSKVLDPLVDFLASRYLATGKLMTDRSLATLRATEDFFYGIANGSLNYVTDQVSLGLQEVTRSFNGLSRMDRTCVGGIPEDAGGRVVQRSTGCVRERLDEVKGIVDQFRSNVEATEGVFSGWLIEMERCSARNFSNLVDAELDDAQRTCYSKAIVSPTGKLIDIPLRWANLAMRTNTAVQTFQARIGLCIAKVGLEVAAIAAEFGAKITQCALRLI